MNEENPNGTPATPSTYEPALPRVSTRGKIIGGVIAAVLVGGLGWLAWDLTHPSSGGAGGASGAASGASGARGGFGGGGPGGPGGPGGGRGGPPTTVGVAVAERQDVPVVIEALGTVVPVATAKVRPQVSGVLQQVLYKEGQLVKKGDLLAQIDPRAFELALQQSLGQRMRDEAQLQAAKVTLERYRTLLQQDSIARQDVDTQEALVKQLEGALVISRANEGTARLNLGYTRIVAPITGRVGLRTVDVGNVVNPSDANGVALITQLSPIDVEFAIPQDQAPTVLQNVGGHMEATALDRGRANALDVGVFSSLDNQVDVQTGTVRAKARFNNARNALFPSQFVNLRLAVQVVKGAVVIPVSSVRRGNNGDFVFVLREDRTVSQRPVRTGQATVDKIQVVQGLQAGERVITEGADRLRDGSRVILPGEGRGPGGMGGMGGQGGRRFQGGASGPAGGDMQGPGGPGGGRPQGAPGGAGPGAGAGTGGAAPAAPQAAPEAQPQVPLGTPSGGASGPGGRKQWPRQGDPAQPNAAPGPGAGGPPPAASNAQVSDKPTPEQRQRILDSAQGDAEQLERRKRFLEALDKGDPQAVERWRMMQQRRMQQGGGQ